jgi:hypothetical protein
MGAEDNLQEAPDDFAFLGLERQFTIASVQLDAAVARVTNQISATGGENTAALQARLTAARQRLSDPVRRGRYLLDLLAGPTDADVGDIPDSLKALDQRVASAADPAAVSAARSALLTERQSRLEHVATLFSFPRNVPNPASQWSRDSAIRNDLRAIEFIDRALAQIGSRG